MIEKMKNRITDMKYRMLVKGLLMKADVKDGRKRFKEFWGDNKGIAVIEVILILVVVMALGLLFRKKIKELFDLIFNEITKSGKKVIKGF